MNRDGTRAAPGHEQPGDRRRRRPGRRPATQIAFVSDRTGRPQIYIVNIDGTGLQQDHQRDALRSADLVAGAVQRDRLRLAVGRRLRHQASTTSPPARRRPSPTATAATRARRSRRTAATSRSRRPAAAASRFTSSTGTARTCGRSPRRPQPLSELVAVAAAVDSMAKQSRVDATVDESDRERACTVDGISDGHYDSAGAGVGACAKKKPPVARPIPPPPPRRPTTHRRPPAAAPPEPVPRDQPIPPEPIAERSADRRPTSTDQQELAVPAGVLRRSTASEVDGEAQQVLNANAEILQEVPDLGDHDRRALRRARHRRVQPGARRAARRGGARPIWCRSAFRPTGCGRSATARNSRSIPATTKRPGRRTAAPTSWSRSSRRARAVS